MLVIVRFGFMRRVFMLVNAVFAGVLVLVGLFVSGVHVLMRMLMRVFMIMNMFMLV